MCSCPLCRTKAFTASPDVKIGRVVNHLRVKCPNSAEGCEWQGQLGDAREHLGKKCKFQTDYCPYDCGKRIESRSQFEEHIGDHCPNRPFQCEYCGYRGVHSSSSAHYTTCQHFPLPCPGKCSDQRFTRKSLKHHLSTECPEEIFRCECVKFGCDTAVRRRDMNNDLANHSFHSISKELFTLKKFCLTPSDTMPDLSSLPMVFRPWLWSEPTCHPLPPWVVIGRRFEESKLKGIYWSTNSEPVYSHYGGYGMSLVMYPGGRADGKGTHLSVFACLTKGANDDNLKFPFKGTITVSLLNQLKHDTLFLRIDQFEPAF